jgi:hypothetical protein
MAPSVSGRRFVQKAESRFFSSGRPSSGQMPLSPQLQPDYSVGKKKGHTVIPFTVATNFSHFSRFLTIAVNI